MIQMLLDYSILIVGITTFSFLLVRFLLAKAKLSGVSGAKYLFALLKRWNLGTTVFLGVMVVQMSFFASLFVVGSLWSWDVFSVVLMTILLRTPIQRGLELTLNR